MLCNHPEDPSKLDSKHSSQWDAIYTPFSDRQLSLCADCHYIMEQKEQFNDVKCKSPKMEMTEFEKAVWSIDFHFRKVTVLGVSTLGLCNSRSNKTAEWSDRPMSTDDNWDANEPFVSTRSSVWPLQCVGHVTNCEKLKQSSKDRNPFATAESRWFIWILKSPAIRILWNFGVSIVKNSAKSDIKAAWDLFLGGL